MGIQRSRRNDLLPGLIRGITSTSLWKAWKAIRKDLKQASIRDVVDFLDFDVNLYGVSRVEGRKVGSHLLAFNRIQ